MRIENSKKNIKIAWALQLVHILCQFVSRTAIIYTLSIEYVGLSGLFSNVLMMLSLAELGIGEAIVFSLYKPISENNTRNINAIMNFYKKVYIGVGIFVLVVGFLITPYIYYFIKEIPSVSNVKIIYMLYVVNTAISYFFSYKAAFINACQKNYLVVLNSGIFEIGMVSLQIFVLFKYNDYVLYMMVGILFVFFQNISITKIANKKFPYLKEKHTKKIPKEVFIEIKKNTGAMVFHKIGTIIVFATDNLIISKFIGLISVGMYANYCTLTNAVTLFINKFFSAISASVGNLAVQESNQIQEKTFYNVLFINFWMYNFSCSCLFCLLNPFIKDIWLSEKYIFSTMVVMLLTVKIYISGMRGAVQTFKNAKGLYWYNRYMPIYESIINLVASVILVNYYGVAGVLLGTIISSILTCVWIEPHVLYKYGFGTSIRPFFKKYILYLFVFAFSMTCTFFISKIINDNSIFGFFLKCGIAAVIPNVITLLIFRNTVECKYFLKLVIRKKNSEGMVWKKKK